MPRIMLLSVCTDKHKFVYDINNKCWSDGIHIFYTDDYLGDYIRLRGNHRYEIYNLFTNNAYIAHGDKYKVKHNDFEPCHFLDLCYWITEYDKKYILNYMKENGIDIAGFYTNVDFGNLAINKEAQIELTTIMEHIKD